MTPVEQTDTTSTNGNCMAACIASLLDLPIEEVDTGFMKLSSEEKQFEGLNNRLLELGYVLLDTYADTLAHNSHKLPEPVDCIFGGKSPRGDWLHAVVGETDLREIWNMVHDPHPDNAGIDGKVLTVSFLIPSSKG